MEDALEKAYEVDPNPFIVGGEQIYRLALPITDRVYLTGFTTILTETGISQLNDRWKEVETGLQLTPLTKNMLIRSRLTPTKELNQLL